MRSKIVVFLLYLLAIVGAFGLAGKAHAQTTCSQPMVLRQETCPVGATACSTKTSDPADVLSWLELDRWALNVIDACNGPMKFDWGVAPVAGLLASDGSGVLALGNLSGDVVTSGHVATIQANAVALGTDTTGGYAASTTEGGPATTATALAANGANCGAGQWAAGVDASGAAEGCTADDDIPDFDAEVPDSLTISSGNLGPLTNTLTGPIRTAGLIAESSQANLGANPRFIGIADGSSSTPTTSLDPSFTFQRWSAASGTTIPFQMYYNQKSPGKGYHYQADHVFWMSSPEGNDSVANTGRIFMAPTGLVEGLAATPSASGGTLATGNYSYYVAGIVAAEERLGGEHVTASVTGPTGSVSLTWTALSGASSYMVYRYRPDFPDTAPVFFAAASNSFTDVGAAGTPGVGRSTTGWGFWGQCWGYSSSSRCATAELNVGNLSSQNAPERTDRVGTKLGIQLVSFGTADTTAGIDFTGESASRFKSAMVFSSQSFRSYGLDFRLSDAAAPAIRLASTQDIVSRNAANTADVGVLEVDASNLVRLGGGATTVDPTNQRLGVVTTSPDERLEIEESANASTIGLVQNTSSGASAIAIWRAESDGAIIGMQAHSSGRTASRFGVTVANYGEILQTTGNGLLLGTSTAAPVIIGTASVQRMTINADGSIDIPQMSVPSNPSSGTRRLFVDSATGKMSVRTSAGATVSLEEAGGSAVDPLAVSDFIDDFRGGSTEAGEVGDHGWTGTGTVAYLAAEANHPGVVRLTTAATNGSSQYLHPATVTTAPWIATDVSEIRVVFRIGAVTAVTFNCGLMADHSNTSSGGAESIRLNFDSSASANFRTVTKNGGGTTTTATSTAAAANTWYLARYVRNGSGNWEFYLNGTLLNTHTTNLPTGALGFSCNSTPLENVAKTWDIDLIQVTTKTLGNRY